MRVLHVAEDSILARRVLESLSLETIRAAHTRLAPHVLRTPLLRHRLRDDALYELGVMWMDRGRRDEACGVFREVVGEFEVGHPRRLATRRLEEECGD